MTAIVSNITTLPLLAKSKPEVSLIQHIEDCLNIMGQLMCVFPKIGCVYSDFWETIRHCVVFHDTGKAHIGFQKLLRGQKPNKWYHQRHELFSVSFINSSDLSEQQKRIVGIIVVGHHKQLPYLKKFVKDNYAVEPDDDLRDILSESELDYTEECGKLIFAQTKDILQKYGYRLDENIRVVDIDKTLRSATNILKEFQSLLLVGGLKQCDHLASAGVKLLKKIDISDFNFTKKYPLYLHQETDSQTIGNVILTSPTGSGKTESAFLWLQKQFETSGAGHVFYILPYTASINAMYERLEKDTGKKTNCRYDSW